MNETPVEEKTFGTDVRQEIDAVAVKRLSAQRRRAEELAAVDRALNDAKQAVTALLSGNRQEKDAASGVHELLSALSFHQREARREQIKAEYRELSRDIDREYEEIISVDPFTQFVGTYIKGKYGYEYAETFFEALPLTYDGLKELASDNDWCTDFEAAMRAAVEREALPDDRVQITMALNAYEARTYGRRDAPENSKWEATFTLPAYMRLSDNGGYRRSFGSLAPYARDLRCFQVGEPAEENTEQS